MNIKSSVNKNLKLTIVAIFLFFLTIIGLTYAYFLSNLIHNKEDESVTVSAGNVELTYFDGNGEIIVDNLMPGEVVGMKSFSVKNTGTYYIDDYNIFIDTVMNDLEFKEDLTYVLICKAYDPDGNLVDGGCEGSDGFFPSEDMSIATNAINRDYEHHYELIITYNETYKDQSNDMEKIVKGRIAVVDNSEIFVEN